MIHPLQKGPWMIHVLYSEDGQKVFYKPGLFDGERKQVIHLKALQNRCETLKKGKDQPRKKAFSHGPDPV
jgi:hypothetical protein